MTDIDWNDQADATAAYHAEAGTWVSYADIVAMGRSPGGTAPAEAYTSVVGQDETQHVIEGSVANDVLHGTPDPDIFFFGSSFGTDVVLDFLPGVDVLAFQSKINDLDITRTEDLAAYVGGDACSAVITLGCDTITLLGVSRDDLLSNLSTYTTIV